MEVKIIASAIAVSSDEDEFVAAITVTAGANGHEAEVPLATAAIFDFACRFHFSYS